MERLTWNTRPRTGDKKCLPAGDGLPMWSTLPLDAKLPMVENPKGSVVLYATKLGQPKHRSKQVFDFDLRDPNGTYIRGEYEPLHDPHLKSYFSTRMMLKHLIREGFITRDKKVLCSLKEFNDYRQYLRHLCFLEIEAQRKSEEQARSRREAAHHKAQSHLNIQISRGRDARARIQEMRERNMTQLNSQMREKSAKRAGRLREIRDQMLERKQQLTVENTRRDNVVLKHREEMEKRTQQLGKRLRLKDKRRAKRINERNLQRQRSAKTETDEKWNLRKRLQKEQMEKTEELKMRENEIRLNNIMKRERMMRRYRNRLDKKIEDLKVQMREEKQKTEDLHKKRLEKKLASGDYKMWARRRRRKPSFMAILSAAIDDAVDILTQPDEEREEDLQSKAKEIVQDVITRVKNEMYPAYLQMLEEEHVIDAEMSRSVRFVTEEEQIPVSTVEDEDAEYQMYRPVAEHVLTPVASQLEIQQMEAEAMFGSPTFTAKTTSLSFVETLLLRLLDDLNNGRLTSEEIMKLASYSMDILQTREAEARRQDAIMETSEEDIEGPDILSSSSSTIAKQVVDYTLRSIRTEEDIEGPYIVSSSSSAIGKEVVDDTFGKIFHEEDLKGPYKASSSSSAIAKQVVDDTLPKISDEEDMEGPHIVTSSSSAIAKQVVDDTLPKISEEEDMEGPHIVTSSSSAIAKQVVDDKLLKILEEEDMESPYIVTSSSSIIAKQMVDFTLGKILDEIKSGKISSGDLSGLTVAVLGEPSEEFEDLSDSELDEYIDETIKVCVSRAEESRENSPICDALLDDFMMTMLQNLIKDLEDEALTKPQIQTLATTVKDEAHEILPKHLQAEVREKEDIQNSLQMILRQLQTGAIELNGLYHIVFSIVYSYNMLKSPPTPEFENKVTNLMKDVLHIVEKQAQIEKLEGIDVDIVHKASEHLSKTELDVNQIEQLSSTIIETVAKPDIICRTSTSEIARSIIEDALSKAKEKLLQERKDVNLISRVQNIASAIVSTLDEGEAVKQSVSDIFSDILVHLKHNISSATCESSEDFTDLNEIIKQVDKHEISSTQVEEMAMSVARVVVSPLKSESSVMADINVKHTLKDIRDELVLGSMEKDLMDQMTQNLLIVYRAIKAHDDKAPAMLNSLASLFRTILGHVTQKVQCGEFGADDIIDLSSAFQVCIDRRAGVKRTDETDVVPQLTPDELLDHLYKITEDIGSGALKSRDASRFGKRLVECGNEITALLSGVSSAVSTPGSETIAEGLVEETIKALQEELNSGLITKESLKEITKTIISSSSESDTSTSEIAISIVEDVLSKAKKTLSQERKDAGELLTKMSAKDIIKTVISSSFESDKLTSEIEIFIIINALSKAKEKLLQERKDADDLLAKMSSKEIKKTMVTLSPESDSLTSEIARSLVADALSKTKEKLHPERKDADVLLKKESLKDIAKTIVSSSSESDTSTSEIAIAIVIDALSNVEERLLQERKGTDVLSAKIASKEIAKTIVSSSSESDASTSEIVLSIVEDALSKAKARLLQERKDAEERLKKMPSKEITKTIKSSSSESDASTSEIAASIVEDALSKAKARLLQDRKDAEERLKEMSSKEITKTMIDRRIESDLLTSELARSIVVNALSKAKEKLMKETQDADRLNLSSKKIYKTVITSSSESDTQTLELARSIIEDAMLKAEERLKQERKDADLVLTKESLEEITKAIVSSSSESDTSTSEIAIAIVIDALSNAEKTLLQERKDIEGLFAKMSSIEITKTIVSSSSESDASTSEIAVSIVEDALSKAKATLLQQRKDAEERLKMMSSKETQTVESRRFECDLLTSELARLMVENALLKAKEKLMKETQDADRLPTKVTSKEVFETVLPSRSESDTQLLELARSIVGDAVFKAQERLKQERKDADLLLTEESFEEITKAIVSSSSESDTSTSEIAIALVIDALSKAEKTLLQERKDIEALPTKMASKEIIKTIVRSSSESDASTSEIAVSIVEDALAKAKATLLQERKDAEERIKMISSKEITQTMVSRHSEFDLLTSELARSIVVNTLSKAKEKLMKETQDAYRLPTKISSKEMFKTILRSESDSLTFELARSIVEESLFKAKERLMQERKDADLLFTEVSLEEITKAIVSSSSESDTSTSEIAIAIVIDALSKAEKTLLQEREDTEGLLTKMSSKEITKTIVSSSSESDASTSEIAVSIVEDALSKAKATLLQERKDAEERLKMMSSKDITDTLESQRFESDLLTSELAGSIVANVLSKAKEKVMKEKLMEETQDADRLPTKEYSKEIFETTLPSRSESDTQTLELARSIVGDALFKAQERLKQERKDADVLLTEVPLEEITKAIVSSSSESDTSTSEIAIAIVIDALSKAEKTLLQERKDTEGLLTQLSSKEITKTIVSSSSESDSSTSEIAVSIVEDALSKVKATLLQERKDAEERLKKMSSKEITVTFLSRRFESDLLTSELARSMVANALSKAKEKLMKETQDADRLPTKVSSKELFKTILTSRSESDTQTLEIARSIVGDAVFKAKECLKQVRKGADLLLTEESLEEITKAIVSSSSESDTSTSEIAKDIVIDALSKAEKTLLQERKDAEEMPTKISSKEIIKTIVSSSSESDASTSEIAVSIVEDALSKAKATLLQERKDAEKRLEMMSSKEITQTIVSRRFETDLLTSELAKSMVVNALSKAKEKLMKEKQESDRLPSKVSSKEIYKTIITSSSESDTQTLELARSIIEDSLLKAGERLKQERKDADLLLTKESLEEITKAIVSSSSESDTSTSEIAIAIVIDALSKAEKTLLQERKDIEGLPTKISSKELIKTIVSSSSESDTSTSEIAIAIVIDALSNAEKTLLQERKEIEALPTKMASKEIIKTIVSSSSESDASTSEIAVSIVEDALSKAKATLLQQRKDVEERLKMIPSKEIMQTMVSRRFESDLLTSELARSIVVKSLTKANEKLMKEKLMKETQEADQLQTKVSSKEIFKPILPSRSESDTETLELARSIVGDALFKAKERLMQERKDADLLLIEESLEEITKAIVSSSSESDTSTSEIAIAIVIDALSKAEKTLLQEQKDIEGLPTKISSKELMKTIVSSSSESDTSTSEIAIAIVKDALSNVEKTLLQERKDTEALPTKMSSKEMIKTIVSSSSESDASTSEIAVSIVEDALSKAKATLLQQRKDAEERLKMIPSKEITQTMVSRRFESDLLTSELARSIVVKSLSKANEKLMKEKLMKETQDADQLQTQVSSKEIFKPILPSRSESDTETLELARSIVGDALFKAKERLMQERKDADLLLIEESLEEITKAIVSSSSESDTSTSEIAIAIVIDALSKAEKTLLQEQKDIEGLPTKISSKKLMKTIVSSSSESDTSTSEIAIAIVIDALSNVEKTLLQERKDTEALPTKMPSKEMIKTIVSSSSESDASTSEIAVSIVEDALSKAKATLLQQRKDAEERLKMIPSKEITQTMVSRRFESDLLTSELARSIVVKSLSKANEKLMKEKLMKETQDADQLQTKVSSKEIFKPILPSRSESDTETLELARSIVGDALFKAKERLMQERKDADMLLIEESLEEITKAIVSSSSESDTSTSEIAIAIVIDALSKAEKTLLQEQKDIEGLPTKISSKELMKAIVSSSSESDTSTSEIAIAIVIDALSNAEKTLLQERRDTEALPTKMASKEIIKTIVSSSSESDASTSEIAVSIVEDALSKAKATLLQQRKDAEERLKMMTSKDMTQTMVSRRFKSELLTSELARSMVANALSKAKEKLMKETQDADRLPTMVSSKEIHKTVFTSSSESDTQTLELARSIIEDSLFKAGERLKQERKDADWLVTKESLGEVTKAIVSSSSESDISTSEIAIAIVIDALSKAEKTLLQERKDTEALPTKMAAKEIIKTIVSSSSESDASTSEIAVSIVEDALSKAEATLLQQRKDAEERLKMIPSKEITQTMVSRRFKSDLLTSELARSIVEKSLSKANEKLMKEKLMKETRVADQLQTKVSTKEIFKPILPSRSESDTETLELARTIVGDALFKAKERLKQERKDADLLLIEESFEEITKAIVSSSSESDTSTSEIAIAIVIDALSKAEKTLLQERKDTEALPTKVAAKEIIKTIVRSSSESDASTSEIAVSIVEDALAKAKATLLQERKDAEERIKMISSKEITQTMVSRHSEFDLLTSELARSIVVNTLSKAKEKLMKETQDAYRLPTKISSKEMFKTILRSESDSLTFELARSIVEESLFKAKERLKQERKDADLLFTEVSLEEITKSIVSSSSESDTSTSEIAIAIVIDALSKAEKTLLQERRDTEGLLTKMSSKEIIKTIVSSSSESDASTSEIAVSIVEDALSKAKATLLEERKDAEERLKMMTSTDMTQTMVSRRFKSELLTSELARSMVANALSKAKEKLMKETQDADRLPTMVSSKEIHKTVFTSSSESDTQTLELARSIIEDSLFKAGERLKQERKDADWLVTKESLGEVTKAIVSSSSESDISTSEIAIAIVIDALSKAEKTLLQERKDTEALPTKMTTKEIIKTIVSSSSESDASTSEIAMSIVEDALIKAEETLLQERKDVEERLKKISSKEMINTMVSIHLEADLLTSNLARSIVADALSKAKETLIKEGQDANQMLIKMSSKEIVTAIITSSSESDIWTLELARSIVEDALPKAKEKLKQERKYADEKLTKESLEEITKTIVSSSSDSETPTSEIAIAIVIDALTKAEDTLLQERKDADGLLTKKSSMEITKTIVSSSSESSTSTSEIAMSIVEDALSKAKKTLLQERKDAEERLRKMTSKEITKKKVSLSFKSETLSSEIAKSIVEDAISKAKEKLMRERQDADRLLTKMPSKEIIKTMITANLESDTLTFELARSLVEDALSKAKEKLNQERKEPGGLLTKESLEDVTKTIVSSSSESDTSTSEIAIAIVIDALSKAEKTLLQERNDADGLLLKLFTKEKTTTIVSSSSESDASTSEIAMSIVEDALSKAKATLLQERKDAEERLKKMSSKEITKTMIASRFESDSLTTELARSVVADALTKAKEKVSKDWQYAELLTKMSSKEIFKTIITSKSESDTLTLELAKSLIEDALSKAREKLKQERKDSDGLLTKESLEEITKTMVTSSSEFKTSLSECAIAVVIDALSKAEETLLQERKDADDLLVKLSSKEIKTIVSSSSESDTPTSEIAISIVEDALSKVKETLLQERKYADGLLTKESSKEIIKTMETSSSESDTLISETARCIVEDTLSRNKEELLQERKEAARLLTKESSMEITRTIIISSSESDARLADEAVKFTIRGIHRDIERGFECSEISSVPTLDHSPSASTIADQIVAQTVDYINHYLTEKGTSYNLLASVASSVVSLISEESKLDNLPDDFQSVRKTVERIVHCLKRDSIAQPDAERIFCIILENYKDYVLIDKRQDSLPDLLPQEDQDLVNTLIDETMLNIKRSVAAGKMSKRHFSIPSYGSEDGSTTIYADELVDLTLENVKKYFLPKPEAGRSTIYAHDLVDETTDAIKEAHPVKADAGSSTLYASDIVNETVDKIRYRFGHRSDAGTTTVFASDIVNLTLDKLKSGQGLRSDAGLTTLYASDIVNLTLDKLKSNQGLRPDAGTTTLFASDIVNLTLDKMKADAGSTTIYANELVNLVLGRLEMGLGSDAGSTTIYAYDLVNLTLQNLMGFLDKKNVTSKPKDIIDFILEILDILVLELSTGAISNLSMAHFFKKISDDASELPVLETNAMNNLRCLQEDIAAKRSSSRYVQRILETYLTPDTVVTEIFSDPIKAVESIMINVSSEILTKFVRATLQSILVEMREGYISLPAKAPSTFILRSASSIVAENVIQEVMARIKRDVSSSLEKPLRGTLSKQEFDRAASSLVGSSQKPGRASQAEQKASDSRLSISSNMSREVEDVVLETLHNIVANLRLEQSMYPQKTHDDEVENVDLSNEIQEFVFDVLQNIVTDLQDKKALDELGLIRPPVKPTESETGSLANESCQTAMYVNEVLQAVIRDMKREVKEKTEYLNEDKKGSKSAVNLESIILDCLQHAISDTIAPRQDFSLEPDQENEIKNIVVESIERTIQNIKNNKLGKEDLKSIKERVISLVTPEYETSITPESVIELLENELSRIQDEGLDDEALGRISTQLATLGMETFTPVESDTQNVISETNISATSSFVSNLVQDILLKLSKELGSEKETQGTKAAVPSTPSSSNTMNNDINYNRKISASSGITLASDVSTDIFETADICLPDNSEVVSKIDITKDRSPLQNKRSDKPLMKGTLPCNNTTGIQQKKNISLKTKDNKTNNRSQAVTPATPSSKMVRKSRTRMDTKPLLNIDNVHKQIPKPQTPVAKFVHQQNRCTMDKAKPSPQSIKTSVKDVAAKDPPKRKRDTVINKKESSSVRTMRDTIREKTEKVLPKTVRDTFREKTKSPTVKVPVKDKAEKKISRKTNDESVKSSQLQRPLSKGKSLLDARIETQTAVKSSVVSEKNEATKEPVTPLVPGEQQKAIRRKSGAKQGEPLPLKSKTGTLKNNSGSKDQKTCAKVSKLSPKSNSGDLSERQKSGKNSHRKSSEKKITQQVLPVRESPCEIKSLCGVHKSKITFREGTMLSNASETSNSEYDHSYTSEIF